MLAPPEHFGIVEEDVCMFACLYSSFSLPNLAPIALNRRPVHRDRSPQLSLPPNPLFENHPLYRTTEALACCRAVCSGKSHQYRMCASLSCTSFRLLTSFSSCQVHMKLPSWRISEEEWKLLPDGVAGTCLSYVLNTKFYPILIIDL